MNALLKFLPHVSFTSFLTATPLLKLLLRFVVVLLLKPAEAGLTSFLVVTVLSQQSDLHSLPTTTSETHLSGP